MSKKEYERNIEDDYLSDCEEYDSIPFKTKLFTGMYIGMSVLILLEGDSWFLHRIMPETLFIVFTTLLMTFYGILSIKVIRIIGYCAYTFLDDELDSKIIKVSLMLLALSTYFCFQYFILKCFFIGS